MLCDAFDMLRDVPHSAGAPHSADDAPRSVDNKTWDSLQVNRLPQVGSLR